MELNTNRDKIPQLYDWVICFHAGSGPQYIVSNYCGLIRLSIIAKIY